MNTPAIPPPAKTPSDPPAVKLSHDLHSTIQNVSLGVLLTITALLRSDFPIEWYIGAMGAGFGVVNLPALLGRKPGSIGGLSLLIAMPKMVLAVGAWMLRHGGTSIAVLLLVASCATLGKVIRTIDVVARDLCEIWGVEQGEEKLGMSPADYCAVADNVRPFADAALAAKHAGGATAAARLAQ